MERELSQETARLAQEIERDVSRWPAALALLLIGIAYTAVPDRVRVGPRWLLLALVVILLVSTHLSRWRGYHLLTHWLARALTLLVTLAVAVSAAFLLIRLPGARTSSLQLLQYAALIWAINIVAFALWYWEIDGGGPAVRRLGRYASADFVFPQFQQDPANAASYWMPGFVDYLFLAFNTSTAFSPTDTLVLSARAKLLMMAQSVISLVVIAVLAARAINTL